MGFTARQEDIAQPHPAFQPYQIVCLEHASHRLYAEVVQLAERRPVCWVRPLALVEGSPECIGTPTTLTTPVACCGPTSYESEDCRLQDDQAHYYDLRDGADLLLPPVLFRLALDTEVIPLLSRLYSAEPNTSSTSTLLGGDTKFSQFLHEVCQAYPDAF